MKSEMSHWGTKSGHIPCHFWSELLPIFLLGFQWGQPPPPSFSDPSKFKRAPILNNHRGQTDRPTPKFQQPLNLGNFLVTDATSKFRQPLKNAGIMQGKIEATISYHQSNLYFFQIYFLYVISVGKACNFPPKELPPPFSLEQTDCYCFKQSFLLIV